MSWRYQPVWIETTKGQFHSTEFGLCEVYFDDDGKLESWTAEPFLTAVGDDARDLRGALAHMLLDAWRWVPVRYADLKVGMTFERALSPKKADALAACLEQFTSLTEGEPGKGQN